MSDRSDAELLSAFANGEASAMEELVARYRKVLYGWLMSQTGFDSGLADDLYQDVWLRIIRNAANFNDVSFHAWMWRIAKNRLIDYRRKSKPDLTLDAPIGGSDEADADTNVDQLPDEKADVAAELEGDERRQALKAAVARLPANLREIVFLRTVRQLSFEEIAKELDIPLNTAIGRMHYATEKLRVALHKLK